MSCILLVEDNPVNQMVAQSMLERMQYEVVVAANGQEAVDKALAGGIDLVLMDLHMPVMDGYEATQKIRAGLLKPIPILAMTADAASMDKENCLEAGMDDHLSKPIEMKQLEKILHHWLSAKEP